MGHVMNTYCINGTYWLFNWTIAPTCTLSNTFTPLTSKPIIFVTIIDFSAKSPYSIKMFKNTLIKYQN